jgi:hypothetical protein
MSKPAHIAITDTYSLSMGAKQAYDTLSFHIFQKIYRHSPEKNKPAILAHTRTFLHVDNIEVADMQKSSLIKNTVAIINENNIQAKKLINLVIADITKALGEKAINESGLKFVVLEDLQISSEKIILAKTRRKEITLLAISEELSAKMGLALSAHLTKIEPNNLNDFLLEHGDEKPKNSGIMEKLRSLSIFNKAKESKENREFYASPQATEEK